MTWPLAVWTDLLNRQYLANEVWRWLTLLLLLLATFVIAKVAALLIEAQVRRFRALPRLELLATLLESTIGPVKLLVLAGAMYVAGIFVRLSPAELLAQVPFWQNVTRMVAALAAAWFIFKLVDVVEFFLRRWTSRTQTLLDDQLVPLVRKTLRVFVVIVAALFIAQNIFNWDIGALLAGLGIGGLAVALAAKDMLANLFGSVTIFADRPFAMGDRIIVKGYDGLVEEVGFRSTRIRTLAGNQVVIPNSLISSEPLENVGRRPHIRRILDVTVTYDTPPEKVQQAVEIIGQMLQARQQHFPAELPPRVYFNEFNPASLNIIVIYWFTPPAWWGYMEFNHHFNMELLRRFNEEGIEFAFPTQTLYLKKSDGREQPPN